MTINGFNIKKYRAKVEDSTKEDGYKIVEGYVSIAHAIFDYIKPENGVTFVPCFVGEEVDITRLGVSGFGKTIYTPKTYREFEIVGEVE